MYIYYKNDKLNKVNQRFFSNLCEAMDSEHGHVLLHADV